MGLLKTLKYYSLRAVRLVLDFSTSLIFGFLYGKPQPIPPLRNHLLLQPATKLAQKIRSKQVKCTEVVEAYISRIKDVHPVINAVVDERFQIAIREAEKVDQLIASRQKSEEELERAMPFLGVPFSCKEHIAVKGMSYTNGVMARKGTKAEEDAEVVKRLRAAGAIPLVSTNLPEGSMWFETGNKIYGTTNNPYDTRRTCGGSSGGEGALIGAGASVIGFGSDLAGSIRLPSCLNGVFGHKPSPGVVPFRGLYGLPDTLEKYAAVGPMCRYATDLQPLMRIMTNDNQKLNLRLPVNLRQLKVYYVEDLGDDPLFVPVVSGVKTAMKEVLLHFEQKHGVKPQKVNLKRLALSLDLWGHVIEEAKPPPFENLLTDGKSKINLFWESIKWCLRVSNHTLPALFYTIMGKMNARLPPGLHEAALKEFYELKKEFNDLLKENCVFLLPSHPEHAPFRQEILTKMSSMGYMAIFNVLMLPVTHIPICLHRGLPVGIQCVASAYNDRLTMAVAVDLEKRFGGWLPPGSTL